MFWKIYSIVGMQSKQWDSTVLNDAEEAGNWGNQIESKQPSLFYSDICSLDIYVYANLAQRTDFVGTENVSMVCWY